MKRNAKEHERVEICKVFILRVTSVQRQEDVSVSVGWNVGVMEHELQKHCRGQMIRGRRPCFILDVLQQFFPAVVLITATTEGQPEAVRFVSHQWSSIVLCLVTQHRPGGRTVLHHLQTRVHLV